jgi:hypothetical protein
MERLSTRIFSDVRMWDLRFPLQQELNKLPKGHNKIFGTSTKTFYTTKLFFIIEVLLLLPAKLPFQSVQILKQNRNF